MSDEPDKRKGGRRKSDKRRGVDPTTGNRINTPEETKFMMAMDEYKRDSHRPFPTWSEVLEVLHDLGYRKAETESQGLLPVLVADAPKTPDDLLADLLTVAIRQLKPVAPPFKTWQVLIKHDGETTKSVRIEAVCVEQYAKRTVLADGVNVWFNTDIVSVTCLD